MYLDLPPALANITGDGWYLAARPYGRFQYRDEMYFYDDEREDFVYWPMEYSRQEILEMIDFNIRLPDPRVAATIPLSWRVGFVVGWLSALAVSQRDDAQAGMVMLAALVAPLLLSRSEDDKTPRLSAHKKGGSL